jgi:hypothetical protein
MRILPIAAFLLAGLAPAQQLFQASDRCMACHNGLATPSGEDISIGFAWRPSLMANSSRDPYWQAGVRRETIDHPAARDLIEDECSICHMPMARYLAKQAGRRGTIFAHLPFNIAREDDRLAADGVSCALCHQISAMKLGTRESFVGGFVINSDRQAYGPFAIDKGLARVMESSAGFRPTEAKHIAQSELCATCHTLYTTALGPDGKILGELPEQVPYLEWLHSDYRGTRSCQDCHMPAVPQAVPIASVLGAPREGFSRHTFRGGNFFIERLLNRFRGELGTPAPSQELENAALRTVAHLHSEAARISIESAGWRAGRLEAVVSVENLGGHKLPTAYPSRRVWVHLTLRGRGGQTVFESGALNPDGSIEGNDNDLDPLRYEPHYPVIDAPGQVQIYESIMADSAGAVTTGLLRALRYLKDNRLLPRGFDKRAAGRDIAVVGEAAADDDFAAGRDRLRYSVPVPEAGGPFGLEAELWYQPIAYRWASNLRPYDAAEPRRFVRFYDVMAPASALLLARASRAAVGN